MWKIINNALTLGDERKPGPRERREPTVLGMTARWYIATVDYENISEMAGMKGG